MKNLKGRFLAGSVLLGALALDGCASAHRDVGGVSGRDPTALAPDYILRARYPARVPDWALDFETFKRSHDGRGITYFLGESGDSNERIAGCELATLAATRKIARQIAQQVFSQLGSAKAGLLLADRDSRAPEELGSHFEDVVAAESLVFLTGVQDYGTYWEERDYTPSDGRKRVYLCQAVVTVDDDHLRDAMRSAGREVESKVSDPEAKKRVAKAFRKLDQTFQKVPSAPGGIRKADADVNADADVRAAPGADTESE